MSDLEYNGYWLIWNGVRTFKASSGMVGFQHSRNQCIPDRGPVPEGYYYLLLAEGGLATDDGSGTCTLSPSWKIQTIPRGEAAGACEPYWANWGSNRVRLEALNITTRNACSPITRGGFYLHDSTKGFSHGCIEVETSFFTQLRAFIKEHNRSRLTLKVKYTGGSTYGGTNYP